MSVTEKEPSVFSRNNVVAQGDIEEMIDQSPPEGNQFRSETKVVVEIVFEFFGKGRQGVQGNLDREGMGLSFFLQREFLGIETGEIRQAKEEGQRKNEEKYCNGQHFDFSHHSAHPLKSEIEEWIITAAGYGGTADEEQDYKHQVPAQEKELAFRQPCLQDLNPQGHGEKQPAEKRYEHVRLKIEGRRKDGRGRLAAPGKGFHE